MPISSTSNTNSYHSDGEEVNATPPPRSSSSHSKIDVMNMSLLSSPLFQQGDSTRQRATAKATTFTTVTGRQTTSGDEVTNLVVGGMEHESLLQDVSSWMREMEYIHDNLQMKSVRCGTTKSNIRSSCPSSWELSCRHSHLTRLVFLFSLHLGWLAGYRCRMQSS